VGAFGPLAFSHPSENELPDYSYCFKNGEMVRCLFCPDGFRLPDDAPYFSLHLVACHQFEIADIEMIASVST
jgi:hypothetical protein